MFGFDKMLKVLLDLFIIKTILDCYHHVLLVTWRSKICTWTVRVSFVESLNHNSERNGDAESGGYNP